MQGLMMDVPLTIPRMILPRAEGPFAARTLAAQVGDRVHHTTWGEVAARARRLAGALHGLGVAPGDRVATFAWNSHRHLEAYLAIPSMGAVLHTLNVRLFPEQVAYIADHAQDRVVLVDRSLLAAWRAVEPRLERAHPQVIVMEDLTDAAGDGDALVYEPLVTQAQPMPWPDIDESAAAGMCYTSGTTGNPKGVVSSHRSTVLHTMGVAMADSLGLSSADSVLAVVPMFHAFAWGLPYAAAMVGASVILPGRDLSPAALCGLIERERPTLAAGVPTIWLGILEHVRTHGADLSSLRRSVCGGSALPPALSAAFENELGVPILHAWGMTETSPLGTTAHLPAEIGPNPDETQRRSFLVSQGRPVPGVELEVFDEHGDAVAHDGAAVGEIFVRGPWVARQYYGDDDPGEKFAGGWLHTGDVATLDKYGYVRITDRTKDLVKSGGEWISSVELEGLIMSHPDVLEAAVIAVPDPTWTERPLACVVPRPEARERLRADTLIEFLRPQVARWWLPDAIVFIDAVPKTSVGKFDKKALRVRFPAMPAGAGAPGQNPDPARTAAAGVGADTVTRAAARVELREP